MSLPAVAIEDPDLIRNAASPSDVGSTGMILHVGNKIRNSFRSVAPGETEGPRWILFGFGAVKAGSAVLGTYHPYQRLRATENPNVAAWMQIGRGTGRRLAKVPRVKKRDGLGTSKITCSERSEGAPSDSSQGTRSAWRFLHALAPKENSINARGDGYSVLVR